MAVISSQQANHIKSRVIQYEGPRAQTRNYFLDTTVFTQGQRLPIPRKDIKADRPLIMVFADDIPLANWGHPCRYLLYELETLELYRSIPARFPPYLTKIGPPDTYTTFHHPVNINVPVTFPVSPQYHVRSRARGRRFAVLFSGMSEFRHVNDLEFLYRTLVRVYRYDPADICVLNFDGNPINCAGATKPTNNWPGFDPVYQMSINGQGTKQNLLDEFTRLQGILSTDDTVLVHINNHGGYDYGETDICCYPDFNSGQRLSASEFATALGELTNYHSLTLLMQQCYSGGFIDGVLANSKATATSIAVSCSESKLSYGDVFNPFTKAWISALGGTTPDGVTVTLASEPTAQAVFEYAKANAHPDDSPQFGSANGGESEVLGEALIRWPETLESIEPIIREHWPEYDPAFEMELDRLMPQLLQLEAEMRKDSQALRLQYQTRLSSIIQRKPQVLKVK